MILRMYTVNKLKNSCDSLTVCDKYKTCIYFFICTWRINSSIKLHFCKHIHLVHQSEISQNKNTNSYIKKLNFGGH